MKKIFFPLSLAFLIIGICSFETNDSSGFQAAPLNANGPSGGQAGAPGEQNCTSCHSGATQNGANENLLVVNNDIGFGITQYTPGASYTVNLSMASNPAKKGFQVTALNAANTMAGNLSPAQTRKSKQQPYLVVNANTPHTKVLQILRQLKHGTGPGKHQLQNRVPLLSMWPPIKPITMAMTTVISSICRSTFF